MITRIGVGHRRGILLRWIESTAHDYDEHGGALQALVLATAETARRDDGRSSSEPARAPVRPVYVAVIGQAAHHLAEDVTARAIGR